MAKQSFGDKVERQVEQLKGGLKDVAGKLTEPDPDPPVDASGTLRPPAVRSPQQPRSSESMTKEQLYADAKRLGIKGRSKMTKAELARAVHHG